MAHPSRRGQLLTGGHYFVLTATRKMTENSALTLSYLPHCTHDVHVVCMWCACAAAKSLPSL